MPREPPVTRATFPSSDNVTLDDMASRKLSHGRRGHLPPTTQPHGSRIKDEVVGGCGGRIIPDAWIPALYGTATLPEFRRRGVQSALIACRLREAVLAGSEYAVVSVAWQRLAAQHGAAGFSRGLHQGRDDARVTGDRNRRAGRSEWTLRRSDSTASSSRTPPRWCSGERTCASRWMASCSSWPPSRWCRSAFRSNARPRISRSCANGRESFPLLTWREHSGSACCG